MKIMKNLALFFVPLLFFSVIQASHQRNPSYIKEEIKKKEVNKVYVLPYAYHDGEVRFLLCKGRDAEKWSMITTDFDWDQEDSVVESAQKARQEAAVYFVLNTSKIGLERKAKDAENLVQKSIIGTLSIENTLKKTYVYIIEIDHEALNKEISSNPLLKKSHTKLPSAFKLKSSYKGVQYSPVLRQKLQWFAWHDIFYGETTDKKDVIDPLVRKYCDEIDERYQTVSALLTRVHSKVNLNKISVVPFFEGKDSDSGNQKEQVMLLVRSPIVESGGWQGFTVDRSEKDGSDLDVAIRIIKSDLPKIGVIPNENTPCVKTKDDSKMYFVKIDKGVALSQLADLWDRSMTSGVNDDYAMCSLSDLYLDRGKQHERLASTDSLMPMLKELFKNTALLSRVDPVWAQKMKDVEQRLAKEEEQQKLTKDSPRVATKKEKSVERTPVEITVPVNIGQKKVNEQALVGPMVSKPVVYVIPYAYYQGKPYFLFRLVQNKSTKQREWNMISGVASCNQGEFPGCVREGAAVYFGLNTNTMYKANRQKEETESAIQYAKPLIEKSIRYKLDKEDNSGSIYLIEVEYKNPNEKESDNPLSPRLDTPPDTPRANRSNLFSRSNKNYDQFFGYQQLRWFSWDDITKEIMNETMDSSVEKYLQEIEGKENLEILRTQTGKQIIIVLFFENLDLDRGVKLLLHSLTTGENAGFTLNREIKEDFTDFDVANRIVCAEIFKKILGTTEAEDLPFIDRDTPCIETQSSKTYFVKVDSDDLKVIYNELKIPFAEFKLSDLYDSKYPEKLTHGFQSILDVFFENLSVVEQVDPELVVRIQKEKKEAPSKKSRLKLGVKKAQKPILDVKQKEVADIGPKTGQSFSRGVQKESNLFLLVKRKKKERPRPKVTYEEKPTIELFKMPEQLDITEEPFVRPAAQQNTIQTVQPSQFTESPQQKIIERREVETQSEQSSARVQANVQKTEQQEISTGNPPTQTLASETTSVQENPATPVAQVQPVNPYAGADWWKRYGFFGPLLKWISDKRDAMAKALSTMPKIEPK
jgi:hypothetical protein